MNQFNNTLYDRDMDSYNRELWNEMTQMEWDLLAPQTNWRANWTAVSPELRDRLRRLEEYEADENIYTEVSVAQAWLARYEWERTELGLDIPTVSRSTSYTKDGRAINWGANDDRGGPPTPPDIRAAIAAAAAVTRETKAVSQVVSTPAEDWGATGVPDDFDHESAFTAEVVDTHNTYTKICHVCFNVDVISGPTQLEEANRCI